MGKFSKPVSFKVAFNWHKTLDIGETRKPS